MTVQKSIDRKAVLFDLDGTLINTSEGVLGSAEYALKQLGYGIPSPNRFRLFLGPPLAECFGEVCGVKQEEIQDAIRLFREEYVGRERYLRCSVYDGIPELLSDLKSAGYTIAVTTSKLESAAKKVLASKGILSFFDIVAGALEDSRKEKDEIIKYALTSLHLPPSEAILIGDRKYDAEGAKKIGTEMIPALWGFGDKEEFASYKTLFLANTPRDVSSYLTCKTNNK